jgi:ribonuclease P protein component
LKAKNNFAMKVFSFKKSERLCSKKQIEVLLNKGLKVKEEVIVCRYIKKSDENQNGMTQLLIAVPKRNVKSAINRNRIKRLIREVYRKNKSQISNKISMLSLSYYSSQIPDYQYVEKLILKIIEEIARNS